MEREEYAYTRGMDDAETAERLRTAASGVLSLARDNDAYALPLAHYYDGEKLYFRLGLRDESAKRAFWDATETACYVVHATDSTDEPQEIDSWSVVVTGRLTELSEAERERFDTAEINRQFTPIRVFDEAVEDLDIVIAGFAIDTMTGRTTPAADH
ncbi:pyridoxamine 5'-phosphate oxidase family protein [Halorubrum sp. N11]|uniref:pyridoxamine 5'-phosphate oxidase family protein n=1 Tax=Halorubrum sp. N11 TaxID=3402276 RepID=UPI003EB78323